MLEHLCYIASPYTHPDPEVKRYRFEEVCRFTYELVRAGVLAYSPISATVPLARHGIGGTDKTTFADWKEYDEAFIKRCDCVIVYMLDGWLESTGVRHEIRFAARNEIPILYVTAKGKFDDTIQTVKETLNRMLKEDQDVKATNVPLGWEASFHRDSAARG